MKIKKMFFLLFAILFVPLVSLAETGNSDFLAENSKTAVFFCNKWNTHCKNVEKFLRSNSFYEKYDIIFFNFDKPENVTLLEKIMKAKNEEKPAIPAVIIDSELLVGDEYIMKNFENDMEKSTGSTVEFINNFGYVSENKNGEAVNIKNGKISEPGDIKVTVNTTKKSGKEVPFTLVFFTALSDAINPCAFAVLMLLVGTILKTKGKRKAMISGFVFSAAIFISYFLMGLGLYKALTIFEVPKYLSVGLGVFAIALGLANLKDAFWYGKYFVMEMPFSWRPKAQEILKHAGSIPGIFFAGLLMSLFLIPCAAGPYVIVVGLLAERASISVTLVEILIYNLIFILPMLATVFVLCFFNLHHEADVENMNRRKKRILHGIIGVILLLVGVYLLK